MSAPTPLDRVLAGYGLDQQAKGMAAAVLQNRLRQLRAALPAARDPLALTPRDLQRALAAVADPQDARQLHLTFMAFFRWAQLTGRLPGDNPMATVPRPTRRPAGARQTEDQVEADDLLGAHGSLAALRAAALAAGGLDEGQRARLAEVLRRGGHLVDDEDQAAGLPATVVEGHLFEPHLDGYAGCSCGWVSLARHTLTAARAVQQLHAARAVDR